MSDYNSIPVQPEVIALRPLNKGMITNSPTQLVDKCAGIRIEGLDVKVNGLRSSPEFSPVNPKVGDSFGRIHLAVGEYVENLSAFYMSSGEKQVVALTNKYLYRTTDLSTWSKVPFAKIAYNNLTITKSDPYTIITSTDGAFLTDKLLVGMLVHFADGIEGEIYDIPDMNTIRVSGIATNSTGAEQSINIYEPFRVELPFIVHWCTDGEVIFLSDGTTRGIRYYDGTVIKTLPCVYTNPTTSEDTPIFSGAQAIAYIENRLVCCGVGEASGTFRVRWSDAFDPGQFKPESYADLTGVHGRFICITQFDEYPVIFTEDSVYFGSPYAYNINDAPPWVFKLLETGGMSIVGPFAYAKVTDGLIYAARDDFRMISSLKRTEKGDFSVSALGCPILKETLRNPRVLPNLASTRLLMDSSNDRLIIGLSRTRATSIDFFAYLHRASQAWSIGETSIGAISCLCDISMLLGKTWGDLSGVTWASLLAGNTTWYSLLAPYGISYVTAFDTRGIPYLMLQDSGCAQLVSGDFSGTSFVPHRIVYETGDFDFDEPDSNKTAYKLAIRLGNVEYTRTQGLNFLVEGSSDKGRTYKNLGVLRIDTDEDEDEVHFRLNGTNLRFRISTTFEASSITTMFPIEIEELTLRVKLCDRQVSRNGSKQA